VDDLNFRIRDVTFEAKSSNRYGTFDWIANRNMEDPSYAYLEVLRKVTCMLSSQLSRQPPLCHQFLHFNLS
jgi:hypothetical protein